MIVMTGRFSHIIQLTYAIEPELLRPYLPPYTELDFYQDASYVSLVGLQPLDLRIYGIPVPWFRHKAQVNLRFYVRRRVSRGVWYHGVVFIKQIIPHPLVALGARWLYNEQVLTQELDSSVQDIGHDALLVQYSWGPEKQHFIRAAFRQQPLFAAPPDEQDFFVDRHWGYCIQRDGRCLEYRFNHPPWKTYLAKYGDTTAEVGSFYGSPFSEILRTRPDFAFSCRGSHVYLERGLRL